MEPSTIAQNLRLLAEKNRNEANFFELAADLQEQGYETDQTYINSQIQVGLDAVAQRISDLETQRDVLEHDKQVLVQKVEELEAELLKYKPELTEAIL